MFDDVIGRAGVWLLFLPSRSDVDWSEIDSDEASYVASWAYIIIVE